MSRYCFRDGGRVIAVISTSVGTHIYSVSPAGLTSLLFKVPLLVRQGIATMDVENRILYFATVANPNRIAQLHLNSGKLVTFPLNVSLSSIQFGNGQLWALGAEYQGPNLSLMRVDVMSGAISNIIRISEYDPSAIVVNTLCVRVCVLEECSCFEIIGRLLAIDFNFHCIFFSFFLERKSYFRNKWFHILHNFG